MSFLFALALVLRATASHATVLLPGDLAELVAGARAIAYGRIVDVHAQWADGRRRIDSLVTLDVSGYLKGDLGPVVTFSVPGGELGAYRSVVVGAPVFAEGDEVVLFLSARGPSIPYVLGLSQGVFRIVTDPDSRRKVVTPPALVASGATIGRVVRGELSRRPVALAEFGALIRDMVAAPKLFRRGR